MYGFLLVKLSKCVTGMKLEKQECSNVTMSWEEANKYCKNKGELSLVKTVLCKSVNSGGGEWLGLRMRWMYKSAIQKNGKYNVNNYDYQHNKQWKNKLVEITDLVKQVNLDFEIYCWWYKKHISFQGGKVKKQNFR